MRLIDADAIVYESIDSSDTCRSECYYGTGILAVRKEDIDEMPTIEERKKGIWYVDDDGTPWCPFCKMSGDGNFCSNCGADMREEK